MSWDHGSGVACFFPFPVNKGVSSSTWVLMVMFARKKEIRNKRKRSDRKVHFMRLLDVCHSPESEGRYFFIWGCECWKRLPTRLGLSTEATCTWGTYGEKRQAPLVSPVMAVERWVLSSKSEIFGYWFSFENDHYIGAAFSEYFPAQKPTSRQEYIDQSISLRSSTCMIPPDIALQLVTHYMVSWLNANRASLALRVHVFYTKNSILAYTQPLHMEWSYNFTPWSFTIKKISGLFLWTRPTSWKTEHLESPEYIVSYE